MLVEPLIFSALKQWLKDNGGDFHGSAQFKSTETSGNTVVAAEDIPADTTVVSCPFSLAITEELAQRNLSKLFPTEDIVGWTERQWISTYISLHWVLSDSKPPELAHYPYIDTLPSPDKLRTVLQFTELELEAFKVSNVYHAAISRRNIFTEEWKQCQAVLTSKNVVWGQGLTWERYSAATTYLSSRSFPSSILSPTPTLQSTSTKPILLPGLDSLNHKYGHPVSWVVTNHNSSSNTLSSMSVSPLSPLAPSVPYQGTKGSTSPAPKEPTISLVLHNGALAGEELFNNYGPRPNLELILGYGFSLPNNPDDTILINFGDPGAVREWEVGRSAQGAEGLWDGAIDLMAAHGISSDKYETHDIQMNAADLLADMVQNLLKRIPPETAHEETALRPEVASMLRDYVSGQRAILASLLDFCKEKEEASIELARSLGVEPSVIED